MPTTAADWQGFYIMIGGAAAALTGLVFVAVSLHARPIMGNELHRDRAFAGQATLLSQVFIAAAVLIPHQSIAAVALEIGVVAAYWGYRTVKVIVRFGEAMRSLERPTGRWQFEWIAWLAWVIALVVGVIGLLVGSVDGGFDLIAFAMLGMLGFGVWDAWVLVSEVED